MEPLVNLLERIQRNAVAYRNSIKRMNARSFVLPRLEQRLKPRVAAKRVQIRILFRPDLMQRSGGALRHHLFKAGNGLFVQTQKRIAASDIVKNHGIVGIDGKRSARPLERAFSLTRLEQARSPQIQRPRVVWMQLEMLLDDA